ncbi:MAG: amidohydrolase family protein, partial [Planctomycetes bacterium]|nr:amidohydrolase family protein [Planctomycetota bacterium]
NHEALPLQDYLVFQMVGRASEIDLPIVIHTGLQAGNYNRIRNADPLHLQTLIEEFPATKFDLFHGGMPWVREIAVLAKYFPGVHLNMAWMHIIGPEQACSALSEWLDMVPNTKIFGFGGDYGIVEKVYGHITIARRNIARVLAGKIRLSGWSREEASRVGRLLLHDNPNRFYNLGLR